MLLRIFLLSLLVLPLAACGADDPASDRPESPSGAAVTPGISSGASGVALQSVATGLDRPLFLTHAGDGTGRLFIVEKGGLIRILKDGSVLPAPFLDLEQIITASAGEQGLLGLAFHPRYATNGRFFVAYTAAGNGANTVAEYRVSSNPDAADPSSRRILLSIPDFASNHNGGMITFGPDGYLYVGTGDGGGSGDPQRNAQDLGSLLGKILRIDVDTGDPYGIPRDNPFLSTSGARPEIWAKGLRNPWRFSFDPVTGDLFIADVGQNKYEEINRQPATSTGGEDYGWSVMEGAHCFRPAGGCDTNGFVPPVGEYGRESGCSVIGGYVYRGQAIPALNGAYLYSDYCTGVIHALRQSGNTWQSTELLKPAIRTTSFGQDSDGELYVTDDRGAVHRLIPAP